MSGGRIGRPPRSSASGPNRASACPKADIVAQSYDLSLNRYREVVHDEVEHRAPAEIIADLEKLEVDIQQGLAELKVMLT